MPLNTVINNPPTPAPYLYDEWKQEQLLQQTNKKQEESSDEEVETFRNLNKQSTTVSASQNYNSNSSGQLNGVGGIKITASAAPTLGKLQNLSATKIIKTENSSKICYVCAKSTIISEPMINCSSCPRSSHPTCLELNPKLVDWKCIREYEWQCMECKKCSKCSNPHDEDKMMFCDRCDRGFHTYCVGVEKVPSGSWLCHTCLRRAGEHTPTNEKLTVRKVLLKAAIENNVDNNNVKINDSMTTPVKVNALLKSKIHSSLNNTTSLTTPTEKPRGRGRPPGSLNKPKDPNSPKKM